MNRERSFARGLRLFFLVFCILGAGLTDTAFTQEANKPADANQKYRIRIKKFIGTGSASVIRTPLYTTSIPRSTNLAKEWTQVTVEYEVQVANKADPWINELLFEYYVITDKGRGQLSLFKKAVRYADVKEGVSRMSTVFLRPEATERFGKVVAAAVEISAEGQMLASESDTTMSELKKAKEWWRNPKVVDSEVMTKRGEGYLLDRSESPFAYINMDDFEVIKK